MISRRIRALSVAAAAVALVTTLALARTVHTPVTGEHASASHGKVSGTAPSQNNGSRLHGGIMTCGTTTSAQDCERLEMLLPMKRSVPANVARWSVKI
ncbi:MAG TPA: hypothetical protein VKG24_17785 [Pseudolabrys sp.]|nr:hypothetical protein [Pseudolabrys sp.]